MDTARTTLLGVPAHESGCRLIVRKDKGMAEILQFVTAGLEIGQQAIALAGPTCLKDIARGLSEIGLRPESLLHNGRLIFLTAPNCLSQLTKPGDPLHRGSLHHARSLVRWVSDWSWAYGNGVVQASIVEYQRQVHDFIRSLTALSLCTVHCGKLERTSLLALLADHRRAARAAPRPAYNPTVIPSHA